MSADPDLVWSALGLPSHDPHRWAWDGDPRWVRFYSQASGQHHPVTPSDHDEALIRNITILSDLFLEDEEIMLVTGSPSDPDQAPTQTAAQVKVQPAAQRWHEIPDRDYPPDEVWPCQLWVSWTSFSSPDLKTLLHEVADKNLERVTLVAAVRPVAAHPYNGGLDVLLSTPAERNRPHARYLAWTSPRPDGL